MLHKLSALTGHTDERVWHVSWSNSGRFIASSGEDKVVRIWASKDNKWEESIHCIATLEDAQSRTIRCCDWSPDDNAIACASFDGTIAIWEAQNSVRTSWEMVASLEGHENEVKSVSWSRDGNLLASCGRDKTVWIWERVNNREYECLALLQGKHGHSQDVKSVRWHPSPSLQILISVSYDDSIKIWKEDNGDWYSSETLTGHGSTVWAVAVDQSGRRLVTSSADKSVMLWQCQNSETFSDWTLIATYRDVHKYPIYSVDWSHMHGFIATGGGDNAIVLYSNTTNNDGLVQVGNRIDDAHLADVNCVRWNPNPLYGDLLASSGDDGIVNIWRLEV